MWHEIVSLICFLSQFEFDEYCISQVFFSTITFRLDDRIFSICLRYYDIFVNLSVKLIIHKWISILRQKKQTHKIYLNVLKVILSLSYTTSADLYLHKTIQRSIRFLFILLLRIWAGNRNFGLIWISIRWIFEDGWISVSKAESLFIEIHLLAQARKSILYIKKNPYFAQSSLLRCICWKYCSLLYVNFDSMNVGSAETKFESILITK